MTEKLGSEVCCASGLVRAQQLDAAGALRVDAAAAIVGDALDTLLRRRCGTEAEASPAPTGLSMERVAPELLGLGELGICWLSATGDKLTARLCGPRGTAWRASIELTTPLPGDSPAASDTALPPMRVMRVMRQQHCDQAGHVNVQVFMDMAAEAVEIIGSDLHICQARISFKKELFKGDAVTVHSGIHRVDDQGLHIVHGIVQQPSGTLACVVETCVAATATPAAEPVQEWPSLPLARTPALPRPAARPDAQAAITGMTVVDAWDTDARGRFSLRALVNLCSVGARQYLGSIGLTGARFLAEQITVAAVDYLLELQQQPPQLPGLGSNLTLRSTFVSGSAKSIRFAHHLLDSDDGRVYATIEIVGVMLDLKTHRSMEVPADVRQRLGLATN